MGGRLGVIHGQGHHGYLAAMFKAAVLDGKLQKTPCLSTGYRRSNPKRSCRCELTRCSVSPWKSGGSSELRGLTLDRVDFNNSTISIDRHLVGNNSSDPSWGPPKTKASRRRIHIGDRSMQILKNLREGLQGAQGHLPLGRPVQHQARGGGGVWRHIRDIVQGAGTGWHEFRHHHASQLIAGGMSPVAVDHRLVHKDDTETLKTYAHLWPDDDTKPAALTDDLVRLDAPDLPLN